MPRPLHITHIVHSLGAGGMENGVANIIGALQGPEFRFSVICLTTSGVFEKRLPPETPVFELNKPAGLAPVTSLRMAKILAQNKIDILHTHNWATLVYSVPARALAGRGRILHGEHAQLSPGEKTRHRLWIRKRLYRFTRRIHTVSRGQKEELEFLGFPSGKIDALVNGVDTVRFHPSTDPASAKAALGIPANAQVIGMVGRFGEFKRHDALIEAFEQLAPQHPNLYLLMVGAGGPKEKATRERVASSPWAAKVALPGFMSDPLPAYQAMDLLVVPSLNEGLSNVALEAMATAVPVLAHPACGAGELLGQGSGGWVRDLASVPKLAGHLKTLLADSSGLAEQSTLARQHVTDSFSIASMIHRYADLYRGTANG